MPHDRLLTVDTVAHMLGLAPKRVHGLVRERKLCCVQVTARERRFLPEQVENFIASRIFPNPQPIDKTGSARLPSQPKPSQRKGGESKTGDSTKALSLKEEMRQW